jgi:plasmid stabilization system protein ParE
LDAIWDWNAAAHSREHAVSYLEFLLNHIEGLDVRHEQGNPVGRGTNLRYILIRRKSRGHGHVAVYRINAVTVDVLHDFHTAQNWQSKLDESSHTAPGS